MDKNKRIALIIFFVIGIGLCTWSIYNSVVTMSQNGENSATEESNGKNSYSQNNNKTGAPVIIDNEEDKNVDDSEEDKDTSATSNNSTNSDSPVTNTTGGSSKNTVEKYISYTISKNESLKDICNKYSDKCPATILSKAILSINNLESSKDVKEGLTLKIPEKYTKVGMTYTVKNGDSLYSIASKYMSDTDLTEAIELILKNNFLTSENIKIGDQLYVVADDATEVDSNLNAGEEESTGAMSSLTSRIGSATSYTVKEDDTLKSISKRFEETCPLKASSNIILKINNLSKSSDIKKGISIKIPDKYLSDGSVYTVKTGDTLYDIVTANMGEIDVNEGIGILVEDNNIQNYVILPGMDIFIASLN